MLLLSLLVWQMLLPCGEVLPLLDIVFADVIANLVAHVIATLFCLADVVPMVVPLIHLLLKA